MKNFHIFFIRESLYEASRPESLLERTDNYFESEKDYSASLTGAVQMDFGEIRLDKLILFFTMTGDIATKDTGNRRIGIVAFQRWSKNTNRLSIRKVAAR